MMVASPFQNTSDLSQARPGPPTAPFPRWVSRLELQAPAAGRHPANPAESKSQAAQNELNPQQ